jgi:hypothetical protein
LTEFTFGPSYNIDLGEGETYVGSSCSSCPAAPTPAPVAPSTYDVYQNCVTGLDYYYVDYNPANTNQATINGVCCNVQDRNKDLDYITTYYGSATYSASIINNNCQCA